MELDELKASRVAEAMSLAYMRGLTQVKGGNASYLDRARGLLYITPSGVPKHSLKSSDIAVITLNGERVRGVPSIEYMMHLQVYRHLEKSQAIVHVHPPYTLALVDAGVELNLEYLSEAKLKIKCYTRIPPLKPGSTELALAVARSLKERGCNIAILEKHGVVACSEEDPLDALDMLESLEDLAKIIGVRKSALSGI